MRYQKFLPKLFLWIFWGEKEVEAFPTSYTIPKYLHTIFINVSMLYINILKHWPNKCVVNHVKSLLLRIPVQRSSLVLLINNISQEMNLYLHSYCLLGGSWLPVITSDSNEVDNCTLSQILIAETKFQHFSTLQSSHSIKLSILILKYWLKIIILHDKKIN